MPNQAKIMKGGIVLSTALVALLFRSSPVMADEYFQIMAMHSQKCAQVDGASQDDNASISQWDCVNQPNVYWRRQALYAGFFLLIAQHSGKCMVQNNQWNNQNVPTPEDNGLGISQYPCNQNDDFWLWKQQPAGAGSYYIVNKRTNKCIQVDGASQDNGASISQWDCVNQPNVKWILPAQAAPSNL